SVVRELALRTVDGRPTIVSTPVEALDTLEGEADLLTHLRVTDATNATNPVSTTDADAPTTPLPQPRSDAYRRRVEGAPDPADPASEVRFRVKEGDGAFATVGVDFATGVAF